MKKSQQVMLLHSIPKKIQILHLSQEFELGTTSKRALLRNSEFPDTFKDNITVGEVQTLRILGE